MNLRVLIISSEYPPYVGGAGVVAKDLADVLTKNNIKVDILTMKCGRNKRKKEDKIKVYEIKMVSKIWPLIYFVKSLFLNLHSYDRIIVNDNGAAVFASLFFSNSLKQKSIVYLHGNEVEEFFTSPPSSFRFFNITGKYTDLLRKSFLIVSVSKYLKEKFLLQTKISEIKNKISIIYAGVNKEVFLSKKIDLRKEYKLSKESLLLYSASRVVKEKGYEEKYSIFKKLIYNDENYYWFISGNGSYLEELKRKSVEDKIWDRIIFLGKTKREDMWKFYTNCDLFWLLSNYEESFGLVYIEAAICGLPSIGKNFFGVKEAIENNVSGYLINDAEECYKVLKEKKFLKLHRNKIILFGNRFDSLKTNKKLIDLMQGERNV